MNPTKEQIRRTTTEVIEVLFNYGIRLTLQEAEPVAVAAIRASAPTAPEGDKQDLGELLKWLLTNEALGHAMVLGTGRECALDGMFNLERVAERLLSGDYFGIVDTSFLGRNPDGTFRYPEHEPEVESREKK